MSFLFSFDTKLIFIKTLLQTFLFHFFCFHPGTLSKNETFQWIQSRLMRTKNKQKKRVRKLSWIKKNQITLLAPIQIFNKKKVYPLVLEERNFIFMNKNKREIFFSSTRLNKLVLYNLRQQINLSLAKKNYLFSFVEILLLFWKRWFIECEIFAHLRLGSCPKNFNIHFWDVARDGFGGVKNSPFNHFPMLGLQKKSKIPPRKNFWLLPAKNLFQTIHPMCHMHNQRVYSKICNYF